MTKSRKRKGRKQNSPPKFSMSPADALTISLVWVLNMVFASLGVIVIGLTFLGTPPRSIREATIVTIAISLLTLILWINGKYIRQCEVILREPKTAQSITRLKTLLTRILSLQPFQLISASMPALTAFGYTTRFSNWLLGWISTSQIGDKYSVGLTWLVGVIVSGVIGNASYDLIKFCVRKAYGRK